MQTITQATSKVNADWLKLPLNIFKWVSRSNLGLIWFCFVHSMIGPEAHATLTTN